MIFLWFFYQKTNETQNFTWSGACVILHWLMTIDKRNMLLTDFLFSDIRRNVVSLLKKTIYSKSCYFLKYFFLFISQFPEVIESEMSTSISNPTSIHDCTDDSRANDEITDINKRMPLSPTYPSIKTTGNDRQSSIGTVRLPVEHTTLPLDCQDLLARLLEYRPETRIRSIFALQRIAFFMGFNFDDAKKKKVDKPFISLWIFDELWTEIDMQLHSLSDESTWFYGLHRNLLDERFSIYMKLFQSVHIYISSLLH